MSAIFQRSPLASHLVIIAGKQELGGPWYPEYSIAGPPLPPNILCANTNKSCVCHRRHCTAQILHTNHIQELETPKYTITSIDDHYRKEYLETNDHVKGEHRDELSKKTSVV